MTPSPEVAALLREIADSDELMRAAHIAVEDLLIQMRDDRMSMPNRANGFVVRENDGSPSHVIRLGTRDGIAIAIRAIADRMEQQP